MTARGGDTTGGPGRKRPHALTRRTRGGAVGRATGDGLPRFACRLGRRFAAAGMDKVQAREAAGMLWVALRMFSERAELARRLAEARLDAWTWFIARSPFVFVASMGADGAVDVSPKGDPPGFVRVLDDRTLAVPDRPGNRRIDTFRNVLANPGVGLIFVIPGVAYTLRVGGEAIVVRDPGLQEAMAVNGRPPDHVLVVGVRRVLSHCPKCMVRSGLWRPEAWPDTAGLPSFAEVLVAHGRLAETAEEMQAIVEAGNRDRLY